MRAARRTPASPKNYPPHELVTRLDKLAQNLLAIKAHLCQLTAAVVADTKRQLEELRATHTGQPAPSRGPNGV
jgi:hypothetical protein